MSAPTLAYLRVLRDDAATHDVGFVRQSLLALLDCEIARREESGGSEDGLNSEQLIVRQYERLQVVLEKEAVQVDQRMGESFTDAKVRAIIEDRAALRAKLADAENRRDKWEAGFDAMRAEVDAVRQALIGLTVPRPDATVEIAALREALRVEREALKYAHRVIQWARPRVPEQERVVIDIFLNSEEYRRAAEKTKESAP